MIELLVQSFEHWCLGPLTNKIYTSQLLQGLKQTSGQKSLAQRTLEAINVCRFAQRHLIKMVGLHFVKLFDDCGVIYGQATKLAQALCGLVISIHFDEIARGLG